MSRLSRIRKICEPFAMGGNKVITFNYFSGPVSYTTGGDAITAKDLGLEWIHAVMITNAETGDRILYPIFAKDQTAVKSIKAMITDLAGTQVANTSDQSTKRFRVTAIGTY